MEALEGIDQRSGRWEMQTAGGAYETARAGRLETRARREPAPLVAQAVSGFEPRRR